VLLFHWNDYFDFLNGRPDVCNKLACFARAMQNVEVLQLEFTILASFGLQLIEPFHLFIKSKNTCHSNLYNFYESLDQSLSTPIKEDFFDFEKPQFPFDEQLFKNVIKHSYKPQVVEAVCLTSRQGQIQDVISFASCSRDLNEIEDEQHPNL
jgi:hypothetical protein